MKNQYKQILLNTASGCIRILINACILILLTPYIISKVGLDGFGLWSLVISVLSMFDLLDMGLGTTIIKYVAECKVRNEHNRCNQILSTLFTAYGGLSILGIMGVGFIFIFFNYFFTIPIQEQRTASYLLVILGARSLLVILPFSLFRGILFAKQYIYLINVIALFASTLYALSAWFVLSQGMGLLALATLNLLASIIEYTLYIAFSFAVDKMLRFRFSDINFSIFRKILPFSSAQFMSNIGTIVLFNSDLIIIKYFLPLGKVALYTIPLRIVTFGYILLSQFSYTLTPIVIDTHTLNQPEKMSRLFIAGTKYTLIPSTIIATGGIICSKELLEIWVGRDFIAVSSVLVILLLSMWSTSFYGLGSDILQMTGFHFFVFLYSWISVAVNLGLSIILIYPFELNGVALGTLIGSLVGLSLYLRKVLSNYQLSWMQYLQQIIPIFIVPAIFQSLSLLSIRYLFPVQTLWGLFFINIPPACASLFATWHMLEQQEKDLIKNVLFKPRNGSSK